MTRDEVISMAREAGMSITPQRSGQYDGGKVGGYVFGLQKFAYLVAAYEREACANICDQIELDAASDAIRARGAL